MLLHLPSQIVCCLTYDQCSSLPVKSCSIIIIRNFDASRFVLYSRVYTRDDAPEACVSEETEHGQTLTPEETKHALRNRRSTRNAPEETKHGQTLTPEESKHALRKQRSTHTHRYCTFPEATKHALRKQRSTHTHQNCTFQEATKHALRKQRSTHNHRYCTFSEEMKHSIHFRKRWSTDTLRKRRSTTLRKRRSTRIHFGKKRSTDRHFGRHRAPRFGRDEARYFRKRWSTDTLHSGRDGAPRFGRDEALGYISGRDEARTHFGRDGARTYYYNTTPVTETAMKQNRSTTLSIVLPLVSVEKRRTKTPNYQYSIATQLKIYERDTIQSSGYTTQHSWQ